MTIIGNRNFLLNVIDLQDLWKFVSPIGQFSFAKEILSK